MSKADRWFYRRRGQVHGPCTWSELTFLGISQELSADDEVRREWEERWQPAGSVPELFPRAARPSANVRRPREPAVAAKPAPAITSERAPPSASPTVPPQLPARSPMSTADGRRLKIVAAVGGLSLFVCLLFLLAAFLLRQIPRGSSLAGNEQAGAGSATSGKATPGGHGKDQAEEPAAVAAPPSVASQDPPEPAAPQPTTGVAEMPGAGDGSGPVEEPEPPPPANVALVRPIGAKGGPGKESRFFDLKAHGTKFVYVVDCSSSMTGEPLSRACQELLDSVNRLEPNQSFFVIFFADTPYPQFSEHDNPRLLPSTPKNRRRLRDWVARIGPVGGTQPLESLEMALSLKPDAIFFLTDGQFSPFIPDEIRVRNAAPIPIHTISFVHQVADALLERIAEDSGGTHRFVP